MSDTARPRPRPAAARGPRRGWCHPSPIDRIADELVAALAAVPPPAEDRLGPATAAVLDYCQERYRWGGADLVAGAYIGWMDALRALAADPHVLDALATAVAGEAWLPERQGEAGRRAAAALRERWERAEQAEQAEQALEVSP